MERSWLRPAHQATIRARREQRQRPIGKRYWRPDERRLGSRSGAEARAERRPSRLRRAARRLGKAVERVARGVRDRGLQLKDKLEKTRVVRVARALSEHTLARLYGLGDRIEQALPGRLGKAFGRMRLYLPLGLMDYAVHKFKRDPAFLGGYAALSATVGHLRYPLLLGMGVSPAMAFAAGMVVGLPLDLTVLTLREHVLRRRDHPDQTLRQTISELHREYERFARHRKRRLMSRAEGVSLVDRLRQALEKPSGAKPDSDDGAAGGSEPERAGAVSNPAALFEEAR